MPIGRTRSKSRGRWTCGSNMRAGWITSSFQVSSSDAALEKLRSRSAVIYVDEAGVEHTLPFIISDAEREQYEKQLVVALVNDSAYVNAVRNSDRQNALDEGFSAIRRIAAASTDMRFQKLYHDDAEFRNGLRNDVLAAAYKEDARAWKCWRGTERDIT